MNIVLISGSARRGSNTIKVVRWLERRLQERGVSTYIVDLHSECFPPDPDQVYTEGGSHYPRWQEISGVLRAADGYVVMSPEWNGMPSGAIVSFFDFVRDEMAYKPTMVGSVSNGVRGGNFPITFLKGGMSRNAMHMPLPDYLIVRDADHVMNGDTPEPGNQTDEITQDKANHGLDVLLKVVELVAPLRQTDLVNRERYGAGM